MCAAPAVGMHATTAYRPPASDLMSDRVSAAGGSTCDRIDESYEAGDGEGDYWLARGVTAPAEEYPLDINCFATQTPQVFIVTIISSHHLNLTSSHHLISSHLITSSHLTSSA